jgi:hypothetical protein
MAWRRYGGGGGGYPLIIVGIFNSIARRGAQARVSGLRELCPIVRKQSDLIIHSGLGE